MINDFLLREITFFNSQYDMYTQNSSMMSRLNEKMLAMAAVVKLKRNDMLNYYTQRLKVTLQKYQNCPKCYIAKHLALYKF